MSMLDEYKQLQKSGGNTQSAGNVQNTAAKRPSILEEHIAQNGTAGLVQKQVNAVTAPERTDPEAFSKTLNNYVSAYNKYASGWNNDTATADDLSQQRGQLISYANAHKNRYSGGSEGEQYFSNILDLLNDTSPSSIRDAYGAFENSDQYNTAVHNAQLRDKYSAMSRADLDRAIAAGGDDQAWLQDYVDSGEYDLDQYSALRNNADFAANSQYRSTANGQEKFNPLAGMYSNTGFDDILYDYINKNKTAVDRQDLSWVQNNSAFLGVDKSFLKQMTADEVSVYNYLYATQGKDSANAYVSKLSQSLNARQRQAEAQKWAEYAEVNPVGMSLLSILDTPLKSLGYLGQVMDYANDGKIDTNAGYNRFNNISSTIRGTVAQNMSDVGNFFYQTGMSMGDFLLTTALSGGFSGGGAVAEALNLAVMGTGAASDTVIEAKNRGLDDDQAFMLGQIAGAAEIAMEVFSVEKLINPDLLKSGAKTYILQNMLTEGLEEVGSDVINTAADLIVSGDLAEVRQAMQEYMNAGTDASRAHWLMVWDQVKQVLLDFAGGAISGGVMAGAGTAFTNIAGNGRQVKNDYGGSLNDLVAEALAIDPNNKMAQKIQEKLNAGKNPNVLGTTMQGLIDANEVGMDRAAIRDAAARQLTQYGERGDINAIAESVAKLTVGEKLTQQDRRNIFKSDYGQRVVNELDRRNISGEGYNSEWTGSIGTKNVNADLYNRNIREETAGTANATPVVSKYVPKYTLNKPVSATETNLEQNNVPVTKTASEPVSRTSTQVQESKPAQSPQQALESASKRYGSQAASFINTYVQGQDVSKYRAAYDNVFNYGKAGVIEETAMNLPGGAYLTDEQKRAAYNAGRASAGELAQNRLADRESKAEENKNTGRRKGTVKLEGASKSDLNAQQLRATRVARFVAEATGVDIVFYKSEANNAGKYEGANGEFNPKNPNEIRIDLNAGLQNVGQNMDIEKYVLLRTFSHEFVHFIEYWNPTRYNEFREVVFAELSNRGQNVDDLITQKMRTTGLAYEKASREVVADAMTDVLPDATFIQEMAEEHKSLFDKLVEKLKAFIADLKEYFRTVGKNNYPEAVALQDKIGETIKYAENVLQMYNEVAKEAVNRFQKAYAVEETKAAEVNAEEANHDAELTGDAAPDLPKQTAAIEVDDTVHEVDVGSLFNAIQNAYQNANETGEEQAVKISDHYVEQAASETESTETVETPAAEKKVDDIPQLNEAATELYNHLGVHSRTVRNGIMFNILEYDGYYIAYATQVSLVGGVPVEDAKHFYNERFADLNQARLTLAQVAQNNNLLVPKQETAPVQEKPKAPQKPKQEKPKAPAKVEAEKTNAGTPSENVANRILSDYLRAGKQLTSKDLYEICDAAFGSTQAEGGYNRKDAYDAMELAVNKYLVETMSAYNDGTVANALEGLERMRGILDLLPTESVRTDEQVKFQQFSTPPNIAYLAAWVANVSNADHVLEPSAGIGGLASFAKAWGAEVTVNELSTRRLEVLKAMGFDHVFNENAEHINNILPDNIQPTVVIMNPPFSADGGRTGKNKTSNAEKHIDQALARLSDGGRLVAILGRGMANDKYSAYWNKLRNDYTIRANLSIDGENYKKYGTTFDIQLVVIDKTGPQGDAVTVTGAYTDLSLVPEVLEGIRNDRRSVETSGTASSRNSVGESVSDGFDQQSSAGHGGDDQRDTGISPAAEPETDRNGAKGSGGNVRVSSGKRPQKTGSTKAESENREGNREEGRGDLGGSNGVPESGDTARSESELSPARVNEAVSDDGVYATFVAPEVPVKGSKKHPAALVESAAMAAVSMPKATYKTSLPADVIKNRLSDAQVVTVTYAGQAHEQKLPDGRRKGFFIGDGTGVGKGRQIAGIILDNFMQGRKKAVWISKNSDLFGDAVRDWTATTGRGKDEVFNQGKVKPNAKIDAESGVLFTTYSTLKMEKGGNRLEQIVDWLGKDFDGVIAFDEAHSMGNLFGKKGVFGSAKGSEVARAGVELQKKLPNARIVYVSATAATEVGNLAYAERLGLWGQGTAFSDAQDFISKIGSSGLAAMELVIRDMKAMGVYVARSISYNGVNYDTVEHTLDPIQTEIYNTMSRAWQKTMQNVQAALESTGGGSNRFARQRAIGGFYSSMQRFYNQVLTSMSMPSVIADMKKELANGHSCVLQIVNTNESQQNKQIAEAKAKQESLDNLDLTPRETLIGYLENSFPTQLFEEYTDENGNTQTRPVLDSKGEPVQDKEAVRKRDELIEEVRQMSIPDGPLEMLFNAFGTDIVAENTGRSRRVVPKKQEDGSIKRVEESRTLNHRTADVQAFQDGKKRILVFSDAGGTGKSYHADLSEKNQSLRIHYVLQPGWVASNAVQGFGRTHRSNEKQPPVYKLVTTNIKGQKRFTSTIARRLDQLGALTKGQRDTGSGMFGAKDNLETDLARDCLREFYRRLGKNKIDGINGMKTLERLGLKDKFTDEWGNFKLDESVARDISTFLNRMLALEVDEQNSVFDAFINIYETEMEAAIQAGTLDTGMENVKADKIEIVDDNIIREDKNTGSTTHYIQAKTYTKAKIVTTVDEMQGKRAGFVGIYKTENGGIRAVFRIADKTTEWGSVIKQYRLLGPNITGNSNVWNEHTLESRAEAVEKADWQKEWDEEVKKVPEYNEDTLHMLTGALLPIWNNLPQDSYTKVKRLIASDGKTYLGRVISKDVIDGVLRKFDVARTKETFTPQQVMDDALTKGVRFRLTNHNQSIFRSRVSGEWRLEIFQPFNAWALARMYPGIMQEKINFRDRYFIPVGEKGHSILQKILSDNPIESTSTDDEETQYQSRNSQLAGMNKAIEEAAENAAYQMAFMEGDTKEAIRLVRKRMNDRAGITPFDFANPYRTGDHSKIAKAIKDGDLDSVAKAAKDMASLVPENAVLVPMPGHTGAARDTLLLSNAISSITGSPVVIALKGVERRSMYESKKSGRPLTSEEMGMYLAKDIPAGKIPVVIDNVVATGTTAKAAIDAIGNGFVLGYAYGNQSKPISGLKYASITFDQNGDPIPLEKRADIDKEDIQYSFRGVSTANKADAEKLAHAQDFIAEGFDAERVRMAFGWFQGYDGKWRKEVDDSSARLKMNLSELSEARSRGGSLVMSDILDHQKLYKYYPQLKNLPVELTTTAGNGMVGQMQGNHIKLAADRQSESEVISTLMHEIQHYIQKVEGFTKGSSPALWEAENAKNANGYKAAKAELVKVENRLNEIDYDGPDATSPLSRAVMYAYLNGQLMRDKRSGLKANIEYDTQTLQSIENIAKDEGYIDLLREYLFAKQDFEIARIQENNTADAFGLYRRTAGEIEAYDVQNRIALTAKQRQALRPDIDRTDVVFVDSEASDAYEEEVQYSKRVDDPELLNFLNDQLAKGEYDPDNNPDGGYITVYRSAQVIDGGIYAPMNAVDRDDDGKNHRLGYKTDVGVWEMATESLQIAQDYMDKHPGAKYAKFDLDGVDNKTSQVAYNPYLHFSNLALNDQLSASYRRNMIVLEYRVPVSEIGAYHAQYAKDTTGWVKWKAGSVATKLSKAKPDLRRDLFVSRYGFPVRVIPPAEVAKMYSEYLSDTNIKVPWNVVTPALRHELTKAGVGIDYRDAKFGSTSKSFKDAFPDEEQVQYQSRHDEYTIDGLRSEIDEVTDSLNYADVDGLSQSEVRALQNKLYKLESDLTDMIKKESAATVKTSVTNILDNLSKYRRIDLESLAEQISRGAWDDYEDLSRAELEDGIREMLTEMMDEMSPLEAQAAKYGFYVRPVGQEQYRSSPLTNRDVLTIAATDISVTGKLSEAEQDALKIFKGRLDKLGELQNKRLAEGRLYREQQFGEEVDRDAAKQTLNRMHILDEQIEKANDSLLDVESKPVLRKVLEQSRTVIEKSEREHGMELLRRYRDRRNNSDAIKKYRDRIERDTSELKKWILHPSGKEALKHVPDALKGSVIPFLTSIDFTSKRQLRGGEATKADAEFVKGINNLRDALKQNIDLNGLYSGYSDLPEGFMEDLQVFIDTMQNLTRNGENEFVINRMTAEELHKLSKIVRVVKKLITGMNKFHQNAIFAHTYEAGNSSIEHMKEMGNAGRTGTISDFVLWQQIRPAYAFERFGKGGLAIYDEFRRGQAQLAFDTQEIIKFVNETYSPSEVTAWEKETRTFQIGKDKVTVPVSYIMGLYRLSKRPQALQHILNGGLRVATHVNGKTKFSDVGHELTAGQLNEMISTLTPRQIEVADALQKFMAGRGGEWGNHVSVARFGEQLFGESTYYPINSDGRHLKATADEAPSAASLYALLNMSFTKELDENATNRIVLYSIFDVFANHMASMAQYHSFALPILDSLKWLNYQQTEVDDEGHRTVVGSVREEMARVYGTPEETRPGKGRNGYAESFVIGIIKAFNGTETQGIPSDATGLQGLHRYNMAQVAYNFRVVVQQPLAITRAGLLIDTKNILRGIRLSPSAIKANIEEMQKYSGIAAWKSLGFYDVNISRGLTDLIKHEKTVMDKIGDVGMAGAELADTVTWAAMWSACKEQVRHNQNKKPGDVGYYEAVTKLFEDVVYKTQVVDSVLTKNEFMRSKGWWSRAIGSFMSEPTTTASMLIDAYDKYHADKQRGLSNRQAWEKNGKKIVRTAYVYAIGSLLLAGVTGIVDAWRDDDDYASFFQKWLNAFKGNIEDEINPMNKLPILRDLYETLKSLAETWGFDTYGNEPRSIIFQWRDSLVKASEIIHDKITGTDTNYTWYGGAYKLLQAASGITGLPMADADRELVDAWNNVVGSMAPSLKLKTYDAGPRANIKYAYQDGYLTYEEAINKLLDTGVAKDPDDAYWTMKEFEGAGKYDAMKSSILAGNKADYEAAIADLTAHGMKQKDAASSAKSYIGNLYKGTDPEEASITKSEALNMLMSMTGMNREDAEATVNEWQYKVDHGTNFSEMKDYFLSGDVSYNDAISYRVTYGGQTREDAEAAVKKWQFEKDTGIAYDDLRDSFVTGKTSYSKAVSSMIKYGGKDEDTAIGTADRWAFIGKNQAFEDITISAVDKYNEFCEGAGISKSVYFNAWNTMKDFTGEDLNGDGKSDAYTKMNKQFAYIDGLSISSAQKTALALSQGISEKNINSRAPW